MNQLSTPSPLNGSHHRTNNQPHYIPYYRSPFSAQQQGSFIGTPREVSSPIESKQSMQPPHNMIGQPSPSKNKIGLPRYLLPQTNNSDCILMLPTDLIPKQKGGPANRQLNSFSSSPTSHQTIKPKIVFSYNQTGNEPSARLTLQPHSTDTSKLQDHNDKIYIGEFQASLLKLLTKDKQLRICSNEVNHVVIPKKTSKNVKRTSSVSRDKYFRTAQPVKKFFKTSGTGFPIAPEEVRRTKESKIASTEATRSFQAETDNSDPALLTSNKETTFDFSSIKSFEQNLPFLKDSSAPSDTLKTTMTFSKYDFGGLINRTCKQNDLDLIFCEEGSKWKSYVKCLFDEEQNLKQSIHCGPDTRGEHLKSEVLTGFGREIAESCIPETQHFQ